MPISDPDFHVIFAETEAHVRAAQALRYHIFVHELGGNGALVDHEAGLELDRFDAHSRHLLLLDRARSDTLAEQVVGVYRVMDSEAARAAGQFYSESEYDLSALLNSGKRLLELGRSCLHADYRGGMGMMHLWSALADHVRAQGIEVLFGVASFHGTDTNALAAPLALLHHRHLAPPELRVRAKPPSYDMGRIAEADLDRRAAMVQVPALIKAYIRLGGFVGEGAHIDAAFKTTDVCLVLDVARMSDKQRKLYTQEALRR